MGKVLTKEETEEFILDYLNELELTDQMYVNFGTQYVSPTTMVHPGGKKS